MSCPERHHLNKGSFYAFITPCCMTPGHHCWYWELSLSHFSLSCLKWMGSLHIRLARSLSFQVLANDAAILLVGEGGRCWPLHPVSSLPRLSARERSQSEQPTPQSSFSPDSLNCYLHPSHGLFKTLSIVQPHFILRWADQTSHLTRYQLGI